MNGYVVVIFPVLKQAGREGGTYELGGWQPAAYIKSAVLVS